MNAWRGKSQIIPHPGDLAACAVDCRKTRGAESGHRRESAPVVVAHPLGLREAHLIGSSFLLLDSLLVGVHCSVLRRGRAVILAGYVVGVLLGLILGCRVVGERREDGGREYILKRGEHL